MNSKSQGSSTLVRGLSMLSLLGAVGVTGCTAEYAGQSLPSPYYNTDDVQYFPPGPEFKLAREAASLEEQRASIESRPQVP